MADTKISALPSSTTPLAGTEVLPIVQSSTTKKVTVADLTAGRTVDADTLNATNVEVTNVKAKDGTAAVSIADSTGVVTIDSSILTTTDINGGAINGTIIGGVTPAAGAFTTVTATTGNITTGNITTGNITTGVFADGSVSAPSVTNTGDTNTGVYFPAADEVAVTAGGTVAAAFNSNGLFFRNRIINGDMRIAQRGTGAVTTSSSFPVDRWVFSFTTSGAVSTQQDSSVPSNTGFINSTKITITTADASIAAADNLQFQQWIEGNNIADLGFGTAGARPVTISFWVRASVTGTYAIVIGNSSAGTGGSNRSYVSTYTINSADTWEYKTVTVPGDTSGTWQTGNLRGMIVRFGLTAGTDFQQAAGSWGTVNAIGTSSTVQLLTTLNATWYVTGVQLETGSVATPFERRPYGTELMLCQRYYYRNFPNATVKMLSTSGYSSSTTNGTFFGQFPVPMRVAPSALETSGTANQYLIAEPALTAVTCNAVPTYSAITTETIYVITATVASGLTANRFHVLRTDGTNGAGAYLGWSAEL